YTAYPKVVKGFLQQQLPFRKASNDEFVLPDVEYQVDTFHVNARHLKAYNRICGFKNNTEIPAIYFAVLSQSLQMHMMTNEQFPFAILGLVHIHNRVVQHRILAANLPYRLSCQFGELRPHAKGVQFDFIIKVYIGNNVVMEGVSTYLSRQKTEKIIENKVIEPLINYQLQQQWHIPENIGRRYARISGDSNLIHLHALSAKLFGFKRAIAHGMWTKAKALATLELPEKYQADVSFKLPVFLPSDVEFLTAVSGKETEFLLRQQQTEKPHVIGKIISL
ncbi:MAG: MaoC/PaaZ C-terminal domain-containing protein, partial [Acinetobacter sp.]